MSGPEELSFDEILKFMLQHDGKVTNHELVKHFKKFLTDPATRDEARNTFKKHVNSLASIKNLNNEKWLILKRKYMVTNSEGLMDVLSDNNSQDLSTINTSAVSPCNTEDDSLRELPPYRPPPEFSPKVSSPEPYNSNILSPTIDDVHKPTKFCYDERKENERPLSFVGNELKSEQQKLDESQGLSARCDRFADTRKGPRHSVSVSDNLQNIKENVVQLRSESSTTLSESEQKISVEERKRMFNRMASEGDVVKPHSPGHRKSTHGVDEEDRASVVPLDPKGHEWIVRASAGDYHALAKMCSENPKLVKLKDPATGTAMHWACKRGDENMVKMLAGLARVTVNERSNGGYTPLHIAMQFRHEDVYKLLIEVYDADPNVRDWSGRKPRQYLVSTDTSLSPDAYRKFKVKADKKNAEKDLGFLRIGSLNVRVKKTTEAFSNFLGVGNARATSYAAHKHTPARNSTPAVALRRPAPEHDSLHKSWGSADNIQNDNKGMPPPQYGKVKRKNVGNRRGETRGDAHSRSTPSTPDQPRALMALGARPGRAPGAPGKTSDAGHDSDSDSAAGFHSAWQSKRSSVYNT